MPRHARSLVLLCVLATLAACERADDNAMSRIDDLALRLGELEERVESVMDGEAMMPDLTPADIPRLEKDLKAHRVHLASATRAFEALDAQLRRHQDASPVHELDTVRAQLDRLLEQITANETEMVGLADALQRDEARKQQRDWKPDDAELQAAENSAQVVRLDMSMRELLLAVEQERMTEEEADPDLRYLMNQRELEINRQARMAFDAGIAASWERLNQLEAQNATLKENARAQREALAVLEADRADRDLLLAAHASARADLDHARQAVQNVETLIERAKQGGS